jgi:hypothetical protein
MDIKVDYDKWTGNVINWVRNYALHLSTGLILFGSLVSILGYCNYLTPTHSLLMVLLVDAIAILSILIGFEVVASMSGSAEAGVNATAKVSEETTKDNDER